MFAVMTDVDREDSFEVASVHDQDSVETFAPDGADPPFDEGVHAGRACDPANVSPNGRTEFRHFHVSPVSRGWLS
jgi:hypothetical protein